jgi:hypothetical protein
MNIEFSLKKLEGEEPRLWADRLLLSGVLDVEARDA